MEWNLHRELHKAQGTYILLLMLEVKVERCSLCPGSSSSRSLDSALASS